MTSLTAICAACAGTPVRIGSHVPAGIDRSTGHAVFGSATGYQILQCIPYENNDRHARAYAALLASAGDAWVTDVEVKEGWTYLFLGTAYHTTFRAMAYPKSPAPDAAR